MNDFGHVALGCRYKGGDKPRKRKSRSKATTWMSAVRLALTQRGNNGRSKTGWRAQDQRAQFVLSGQEADRFHDMNKETDMNDKRPTGEVC